MDDTLDRLGFLVAIFLSIIIGIGCAGSCTRLEIQKEAVEKGFASYNPTNGVWGWKENKHE